MPEPLFLERGDSTLVGTMYRAAGDARNPTLVYAAGFPSPHIDASDLAYAVRARGWNVVTFRYRGTWGSTGVPSLDAWKEDIRALVAFALADGGVDSGRLALGGTSFGAWLAGSHAASDDRVSGVLLLSPRVKRSMSGDVLANPSSPAAVALIRLGTLALANIDDATRRRLTAELLGAPSLLDVSDRLRGRRVFVASGDRDPIPADDIADLVQSTGAESFRHPDADHGFTRHRELLVSRVADWLATAES